jgi:hypothetical protein
MQQPDTVQQLSAIISEAESMRNAYYFTPPYNASGRRAYEKRHSHPAVSWTESGHSWTASYTVTCSCRNVYASGEYTRDGKKTTLLAIRNSYARMLAALD